MYSIEIDMEQQNNNAGLNEIAGVLPMDTGVTVNGVHGKQKSFLFSSDQHLI